MKSAHTKIISIAFLTCAFYLIASQANAASLSDRLAGQMLLQTQNKGQAWYVHPATKQRHFLYHPEQAFQIMREQGVGITNENLEKIPLGLREYTGTDSDSDGLPDALEQALGTDPNKTDTDGDTYDDRAELLAIYNPKGTGMMPYNAQFAKQHKGKIFLQVESKGEAWWVNPSDEKRYFLGRPADALALMRAYGLGISDTDIKAIPVTANKMDCLTDQDCLIAATEVGQPTRAAWNMMANIYGIIVDSDTDMEITSEATRHRYQQKTMRIQTTLSDELKEALREDGKTEEEITQVETEAQTSAQEAVGTMMTCHFGDANQMANLLRQWQAGNFTDEDLNFAECETQE